MKLTLVTLAALLTLAVVGVSACMIALFERSDVS